LWPFIKDLKTKFVLVLSTGIKPYTTDHICPFFKELNSNKSTNSKKLDCLEIGSFGFEIIVFTILDTLGKTKLLIYHFRNDCNVIQW